LSEEELERRLSLNPFFFRSESHLVMGSRPHPRTR
jgi:hypothetical protein